MKILDILSHWWKKRRPLAPPTRPLPATMVRQLVMGVGHTQPQELSCDEVYELLDLFAEMISRGEDAATLMPLVQHHLQMCPECREEYEALLRTLEATKGHH